MDEAKALAVILIIAGHMACPDLMKSYMFTFHVPIFFIISGYFFRIRSIKEEVIKVSKTILIPYLFFSLISMLYAWYQPYMHPDRFFGITGGQIVLNGLIGIVRGENIISSFSYMPYPPLWFLVALAVVRLFCQIVFSVLNNKYQLYVACILSCILAFLTIKFQVSYLSLRQAMICCPFFLFGMWLQQHKIITEARPKVVLLLGLGIIFLVSPLNGHIDINGMNLGKSVFLLYFFGVSNSIFVISLLKSVRPIGILQDIGKNTLCVLGMSGIIGFALTYICIYFFTKEILVSPLFYLIAPLIIVYIGSCIGKAIDRYCPFLLGRF